MDLLTKHSTANNPVLKIVAGALFILFPVIGFVLGMQFQALNNQTAKESVVLPKPPIEISKNWKTYKNTKYNYSIDYPTNWVVRGFSDEGTGAAFRPANKPNDYMSEFIKIDKLIKVLSEDSKATSFEDYVKTAAMHEIQNYKSLASIKKITTTSGLVGYVTTWNVAPIMGGGSGGGGTGESEPRTYFEIPGNNIATIQVTLDNEDYLDIYNKMLSTFKFLDSQQIDQSCGVNDQNFCDLFSKIKTAILNKEFSVLFDNYEEQEFTCNSQGMTFYEEKLCSGIPDGGKSKGYETGRNLSEGATLSRETLNRDLTEYFQINNLNYYNKIIKNEKSLIIYLSVDKKSLFVFNLKKENNKWGIKSTLTGVATDNYINLDNSILNFFN